MSGVAGAGAPTFGADYHEVLELTDGSRVELRPVGPMDKVLFVQGLEKMSPESRFRRFLWTKNELSDDELSYLTELDGARHFAIGAVRIDLIGREEGVGVARMIAFPDDPKMAEPAVAVIDELHHRGLGRALLERLVRAAVERGIERFRFEVLASNEPMRDLIRQLAPDATQKLEGEVVVCEIELPTFGEGDAASKARETAIYRLLALVAKGVLLVQHALDRFNKTSAP